ncbi:PIR protein, partial [Plasmodium vivax]
MDHEEGDDYYEYVHLFPKYKATLDDIIKGDNHANDISNCHRSAKESFREHEDYKKQCPKIAKYLTHLNNSEDGDNFKRCRFLNYLLNSEKIYNQIDSHSKSDIIEAYNKLTHLKYKCYGNIGLIKDDIFSQLQILYKLYDSFYKIKIKDDKEDKIICENAGESVQLYGQNYEYCRKNSKEKFCQQLIHFQKLYNELMKNVTNCSKVSNYLPNIETDFISPIILTSVIFTPLGSWLLKQRVMKKTIIDDINKKNLKLSQNSKYEENNLSK